MSEMLGRRRRGPYMIFIGSGNFRSTVPRMAVMLDPQILLEILAKVKQKPCNLRRKLRVRSWAFVICVMFNALLFLDARMGVCGDIRGASGGPGRSELLGSLSLLRHMAALNNNLNPCKHVDLAPIGAGEKCTGGLLGRS